MRWQSACSVLAEAADGRYRNRLDYHHVQNYGYMGLYGGLRAADIKVPERLEKEPEHS